jgi:hypothetical protein
VNIVISFLLLTIATVALHLAPAAWQADTIDALTNNDDDRLEVPWSLSPNVRVDNIGAAPELLLVARGIDQFASAQLAFTPAVGLDHIFVEVQSTASELHGQASLWPQVGVLLHALDKRGKRLDYWPYRATGRNGNHAWATMRGLWPVPREATRVRAIAYLLADTGRARIQGLKLQGAKTRATYTATYYTLGLAWLAFAAFCARRALAGSERRPLRVATVTLAATLVVAGVAPQPYVYESVRSVTFTAQDALDSLAFDWHTLTAPAPAETSPGGAQQAAPEHSPARSASAQLEKHEPLDARTGAKPVRQHYWEPEFPFADKLAHMSAFLVLAICAALAWSATPWVGCITGTAGVSASIQILQTMTVTREFDWWDFAADLTGIVAGVLCVRLLTTLATGRHLHHEAG